MEVDDMFDLTPVFQVLTGLFAAVLTAVVIPLIKSKICAERLERAREWARIVVGAAEGLFPQPGSGQEKKTYALDFLERQGLALGLEELDALIECAACELAQEKHAAKGARICRS